MMTLEEAKKYITDEPGNYISFIKKINCLLDSGFTKKLKELDRIQFNKFAIPLKNKLYNKFKEDEPDSLVRNLLILKYLDKNEFSRLSNEYILVLKYYETLKILCSNEK